MSVKCQSRPSRASSKSADVPYAAECGSQSNERRRRILRTRAYADFRCGLAEDFFAAASLGFLPSIGISISFCPLEALRGFLVGLAAFAGAASLPTLLRSASIRSTTLPVAGAYPDIKASLLLADRVQSIEACRAALGAEILRTTRSTVPRPIRVSPHQ
jgi:hypothetical protein